MQGESWEGCSEPHERSQTHLSICHMKTQHSVFAGCHKWNGSLEGLRNDWFCSCGMMNYGTQPLNSLVVPKSLNLIPSHNISMLDGICMKQGDATSDIALWRSKILSCHFSFTAFTSPGEISLSHPLQYVENIASWHLQPKRCESTWKYVFSPSHIFDHCRYKLFLECTFRESSDPDSCW